MKLRCLVGALAAALALAACRGTIDGVTSNERVGAPNFNRPAARDRFASERLWGAQERDDWEPTVAADRSSSWVYQVTTKQHPNFLLFRGSPDGGTTWNQSRHICRRGIHAHFQFDPQIAVARDGTVDVACLDNYLPGVVFAQSHDHGTSWSAPIRLDGNHPYSDKPILLIGPSGSDVYVAFNAYDKLLVAASHDGGTTWAPPVKASSQLRWYYPSGGTVGRDGSVWFAVDGEGGKNETGAGQIALLRSTDGGATWTTIVMASTHEGAPCHVRHCYPDFFTGQEAIAVDGSGAYAFVYAQNSVRQGPNTLYATRSKDGARWSDPRPVGSAGNATSPAIAAGPANGDFRLVWQDNRNGLHAWNTWYARSRDGGATWNAPIRLSDRGNGAPYKHPAGYDFPFGDYLGMSVDASGVTYVIWGEGSAVYTPGGTWFTHSLP
ncbi:MAG TPA: sialidase family protein [Candidatus Tumulicola sp.]|jgi:photosystem II stability/assembly factor-like uncharacterized protein